MKKFVAALAFGLALAGAAQAQSIDNAFGNTVVVTLQNGASLRYHFNADRTFTLHAPDGTAHNGTWEIAGDQLCLTSEAMGRSCSALEGDRQVGDTWTSTSGDGSTVTLSLQRGR
ncbi:MAG TPA: hypothetical protein PLN53_03550 [Terricaulis sp.]|nr:hypothetical protein [Terricaulis sp.]